MGIAGGCRAQSPESRFTSANTRVTVNHDFFRKADFLTALSRSRHSGATESGYGTRFSPLGRGLPFSVFAKENLPPSPRRPEILLRPRPLDT